MKREARLLGNNHEPTIRSTYCSEDFW